MPPSFRSPAAEFGFVILSVPCVTWSIFLLTSRCLVLFKIDLFVMTASWFPIIMLFSMILEPFICPYASWFPASYPTFITCFYALYCLRRLGWIICFLCPLTPTLIMPTGVFCSNPRGKGEANILTFAMLLCLLSIVVWLLPLFLLPMLCGSICPSKLSVALFYRFLKTKLNTNLMNLHVRQESMALLMLFNKAIQILLKLLIIS